MNPIKSTIQTTISILENRHLLYQFSVREIQMQYRGSYLGVVWTLLNPIFMLGIYTFVFGYIFGGSFSDETPAEHALGIFIGLSIHNFLSEVMTVSPTLIESNSTFVKRVIFPLEILVASKVVASFFTFTLKWVIILATSLILGNPLSLNHPSLIFLVVILTMLSFAIALIFSSIGTFVKDLGNATQFLSMGLLFGSAVFYPISKIPENAWAFLKFNPLIYLIEYSRNIILWSEPFALSVAGLLIIFTMALFGIGCYCFQLLKPAFSDVI